MIAAARGRDPEPPKPKKEEPSAPLKPKPAPKIIEDVPREQRLEGVRREAREALPGLIRKANIAHDKMKDAEREMHAADDIWAYEGKKWQKMQDRGLGEKLEDAALGALAGGGTGRTVGKIVTAPVPASNPVGAAVKAFAPPLMAWGGATYGACKAIMGDDSDLATAQEHWQECADKWEKLVHAWEQEDRNLKCCLVDAATTKISIDSIDIDYPTSLADLHKVIKF